MSKRLRDLTDKDLNDLYVRGSNWLAKRMQVTGTDKNEMGEKYNHAEFEKGLRKVEAIEREMQKRNIAYS